MPVDCKLGAGVKISHPDLVNIYGGNTTQIGEGSTIGPFTEVQSDVKIGSNCKISSHSFICSGVSIGDGSFVGHGVIFCNDKYPAALNENGELKGKADWTLLKTIVEDGASIGSNATILGGIRIGKNARIGAGAVVTKDVPANDTVVGNPAKSINNWIRV